MMWPEWRRLCLRVDRSCIGYDVVRCDARWKVERDLNGKVLTHGTQTCLCGSRLALSRPLRQKLYFCKKLGTQTNKNKDGSQKKYDWPRQRDRVWIAMQPNGRLLRSWMRWTGHLVRMDEWQLAESQGGTPPRTWEKGESNSWHGRKEKATVGMGERRKQQLAWEKEEGHSLQGRKGNATVDMGESGKQQLTW